MTEYFYSKVLNVIYLHGTKINQQGYDVYVPLTAFDSIEINEIDKFQKCLCENEKRTIIVAVVDSNSTIIYYRFSSGIGDLQ